MTDAENADALRLRLRRRNRTWDITMTAENADALLGYRPRSAFRRGREADVSESRELWLVAATGPPRRNVMTEHADALPWWVGPLVFIVLLAIFIPLAIWT